MADIPDEVFDAFSQTATDYQNSLSELSETRLQLSQIENLSVNTDDFFEDAKKCGVNGPISCEAAAEKLNAQFGDDVDPTLDNVIQGVENAKKMIEEKKEVYKQQIIEKRRDAIQKLTDLTEVGKKAGVIGDGDLNANGLFDAGQISFDVADKPLTQASKTLVENTKTIVEDKSATDEEKTPDTLVR